MSNLKLKTVIPLRKRNFLVFGITFLLVFSSGFYAYYLGQSELVHFWVRFPVSRVRPIIIYADERGLKQIFEPSHEGLSTHWIVNNDTKPHTVKLELVNVTIPVTWEVHAGDPYDPETKTFTQPIPPKGQISQLGIDWVFYFPEDVREKQVWYSGGLKVIDAETGKTLLFQPIQILKSRP